jgi:hypothetical protein
MPKEEENSERSRRPGHIETAWTGSGLPREVVLGDQQPAVKIKGSKAVMHLSKLVIKNFCKLKYAELSFQAGAKRSGWRQQPR